MPSLTQRTVKHRLIIGLILLLGSAVSIGVWAYVKSTESARITAEFNRRAEVLAHVARDQIRLHAELVRGMRSYIENSQEVDATEFNAYCASLSARLPSATVFQWIPRVPAAERSTFETAAATRLPGYRIWEREVSGNASTSAISARTRDEHWPILHLSPIDGHAAALGYDVSASIVTRPMLDAARRLHALQLSPQVPLIYDPAKPRGDGVIFIEPVFRPASPHAAPDGFIGFIQAIFRIEIMLGEALTANPDPALDFAFIDDSAFNRRLSLLYGWRDGRAYVREEYPNSAGPDQRAPVPVAFQNPAAESLVQRFEIGGRRWQIVVAQNPRWREAQNTLTPTLALGTWIGLTLLAAFAAHGLLARTDRIESEVAMRTAELAENRHALESFLQALPGMAYSGIYAEHFEVTFASEGSLALTGYPPADFIEGRVFMRDLLHPDDLLIARSTTRAAAANRQPIEFAYRIRTRNGTEKWILTRGRVRGVDARGFPLFEGLAIDITDQKNAETNRLALERKLLETQKLESLGLLAGGIAHDFNNLLTAILGQANLARLTLADEPAMAEISLKEIEAASVRAAELCAQLLAYAGKGRFTVEPNDLNYLINGLRSLLRVSVGKHAALQFHLNPELPAVMADATQLRQIVMNLVINATEAIGERGGAIHVTTGVCSADAAALARAVASPDHPPGNYVFLEVRDDGPGMTPEVLAKIFDPFFTTKFTGRGLGLAAVLGIVRGHRGALQVESTPEIGTMFRLLLPPISAAAMRPAVATPALPLNSAARVLVVDDDDTVRPLVAAMLRSCGCNPEEVSDGYAALTAFRAAPDHYDLVVLDLLMPGMSGEDTLVELRRVRADVRVLIISGYNEGGILTRRAGGGPLAYLAKPFTRDDLGTAVRSLLP